MRANREQRLLSGSVEDGDEQRLLTIERLNLIVYLVITVRLNYSFSCLTPRFNDLTEKGNIIFLAF